MRRCPHRINFRLTTAQFQRYSQMVGRLVGIQNWTDLCLKGLEELAINFAGPWNLPLIPPRFDSRGFPILLDPLKGSNGNGKYGNEGEQPEACPKAHSPKRRAGEGKSKNGKKKLVPKKLRLKAKRKTG